MSELNINKFELLMILRDKDFFPDALEPAGVIWKDRRVGKVVLFNEKKEIALIGNNVNNFFGLPGGGIEDNEDILQGIKRECKEETGCEIKLDKILGLVEDFRLRDSRHSLIYAYSASLISYGVLALTSREVEVGVYLKWFSVSDALELFKNQEQRIREGEIDFYNTCFNVLRDHCFIKKALLK